MKLATATNRHRGGGDASSRLKGGRSGLAAHGGRRWGADASPATGRRRQAAFTLAEVLVAMLFMAIVIPTAVEALHVASRAGEVAARKSSAARVADLVLNESLVLTNWNGGVQNGTIQQGTMDFNWTLTSQAWPVDNMEQLTATVTFPAQGRNYSVELSTLAPLGGTPNQPVAAMSLR